MTEREAMHRRRYLGIMSFALGWMVVAGCVPGPEETPIATTMTLGDNWQIQEGKEVEADGAEISTAGFAADDWLATSVPTTVLAALTQAGEIEDPYFARNLERIPTEPFAGPWWYRTEFEVELPSSSGSWLAFEGINYSADIWLNGEQLGTRDEILGAFRMFEIDVSGKLVSGTNALAVLVYPPQPGVPTIGFVDWNPRPPDRNMGLWREVKLRLHRGVAVDRVFVRSDLDPDRPTAARLTIEATVANQTERNVAARVTGTISDGIAFEYPVELTPGETRQVVLSAEDLPQLAIDQPRLWWPNAMGEPELYELDLRVMVDGQESDRQQVRFGIRQVEDYLTEEGYRGYKINGKPLLIRGGGWVDDLMLADTDQKLEDQIRYVRHMNLNTIRLEGFWGSSHRLFDLADRYGILVMVGWSCQWEWEEYLEGPVDEFGGIDTPEEIDLVSRSLRDQVVWLRNHPSVFVWVLGSDMLPRPELERRYRVELADVDPTRPALSACATATSEVSGPSGVKMNGPYDWVPPIYWYVDQERGGAYGFNTETGPGPQPPPVDSIRRMLPQENWWPVDDMWDYHSGRNEFNSIARYHQALDARYGAAENLEDFARRAQLANYEGMRAMFEAFSIRRPATTGLVQWMLNSAWPEMFWQLYDHYLVPNGAFYGARDASRPINIAYDRADRDIVVVNDTPEVLAGLTARIRAFDASSAVLIDQSIDLDVAPETIQPIWTLPEIEASAGVVLLDARLIDGDGATRVKSFYWLPATEDVPDWEASEWFYTPTQQYADLSALIDLPAVDVAVTHSVENTAGGKRVHVTLKNPSETIAFFIELKLQGADSGQRLAPVLWSDNYVSLLPGEELELQGQIPGHALGGEEPALRYSGINVPGNG